MQDCRFQIAQVDYQCQARNTRIFERTPLIDTSYCIRHRFELKYFHFAQFCSLLIEQLINLENMRTYNLKFRTDLRDGIIDGWSVTQQMIVYKDSLLKKSSNWTRLVLSTLVTTWLSNTTFRLRPIWLQTLVVIVSESCQISFPSYCVPLSEVAVLINSNLCRLPFLGQVTLHCDLLGCKHWLRLIQNHRVIPDVTSKLLHATIWRCCAVRFES